MELNYSINTHISVRVPLNLTTSSTPDSQIEPVKYWVLCLGVLIFITLFGNILVVRAVKTTKQLQTVTNYLIVSLAIADITVGALVMPLAVYVEVMGGRFLLHNKICDVWLAVDVLACSASILNMCAISIDRYLAIRHAILYTNQIKRDPRYLVLMIAFVWGASLTIAMPLLFGINDTEHRAVSTGLCIFFNPIYSYISSFGSFILPTVAMVIFYYLVFKVIRQRAIINSKKKYKRSAAIISIKAESSSDSYEAGAETSNNKIQCSPSTEITSNFTEQYNNNHVNGTSGERLSLINGNITTKSPDSFKSVDVSFKCDDILEEPEKVWVPQRSQNTETITHYTAEANAPINLGGKPSSNCSLDRETQVKEIKSRKRPTLGRLRHALRLQRKMSGIRRDRRENREKKATITLVVVVGAFLVCWIPFFIMNNINAVCLQWKMDAAVCDELGKFMPPFVWLGYINSTINPIIYAVFNMEYRKAFKKLLSCTKNKYR